MVGTHRNAGRRGAWIATALLAAACQAAPAATPGATVAPTAAAQLPTAAPSPDPTVPPSLRPVPPGRIAFMRMVSEGIEHYFTINSDGTDERAIFEAEHCECVHWLPDGSRVMSLGESGQDVWSLMTVRPDGTDRTVIPTPIKTLSLAVGAASADGTWLAFNAWDNEHPSNTGLYIAHADLTELRQVLPIQQGMLAIEPFGVTPDGSQIVFFADTGPHDGITHAGDAYVINADGTDLRRLNPGATKAGYVGPPVISLEPNGRRAAFGTGRDIYVADLETGETLPIPTEGYPWAVAWSPAGDWIAYTLNRNRINTIWLVRPDGSEQHKIPAAATADRFSWAVWSPDGAALLAQNDNTRTGGRTDLWAMDLEGNLIGQVTHEPADYGWYGWAPVYGGS
jgi:Tol biopolymer transport system component